MFVLRLKELRKSKKISQLALAETLGVSQQAVGKWETRRSTPDPATVARIADFFDVSTDYLLGCSKLHHSKGAVQVSPPPMAQIPIIGTVRAGYGALAFEDDCGMAAADVRRPEDYFYLLVRGDSMEPRIREGDLALVHRQSDVENGELAVVMIDGEEATLKKMIKKDGMVILQPFNATYAALIFTGADLEQIQVVGKVVETKARW